MTQSWYTQHGKRLLDAVISGLALLTTAPLHAMCAAVILTTCGRPVYFLQERSGRDGMPFKIIKFRTMRVGVHEASGGYPSASAVTPVGRWLRRTSLDELPQLINILRGDMSFVGPRPSLPSQAVRYTDEQRRRLSVRPGLTGLAQIEGRNSAPWSRRIESDIRYIDRVNLRLDLRIMVLTIPAALGASGQEVGQTSDEVDDLSPVRLAPPGWPGLDG